MSIIEGRGDGLALAGPTNAQFGQGDLLAAAIQAKTRVPAAFGDKVLVARDGGDFLRGIRRAAAQQAK